MGMWRGAGLSLSSLAIFALVLAMTTICVPCSSWSGPPGPGPAPRSSRWTTASRLGGRWSIILCSRGVSQEHASWLRRMPSGVGERHRRRRRDGLMTLRGGGGEAATEDDEEKEKQAGDDNGFRDDFESSSTVAEQNKGVDHEVVSRAVDSQFSMQGLEALSSLLREALESKEDKVASLLVTSLAQRGCPVDSLSRGGCRPLHAAAARGMCDTVSALLDAGASPNALASNGSTPLHVAAGSGRLVAALELLDGGADIHAVDGSGKDAYHRADEAEHHTTARMLMELMSVHPGSESAYPGMNLTEEVERRYGDQCLTRLDEGWGEPEPLPRSRWRREENEGLEPLDFEKYLYDSEGALRDAREAKERGLEAPGGEEGGDDSEGTSSGESGDETGLGIDSSLSSMGLGRGERDNGDDDEEGDVWGNDDDDDNDGGVRSAGGAVRAEGGGWRRGDGGSQGLWSSKGKDERKDDASSSESIGRIGDAVDVLGDESADDVVGGT